MSMTNKLVRITLTCTLLLLMLSACDSDSSTGNWTDSVDGQVEPAEPVPEPVGPDLNGNDWAGYYKSVNGNFDLMTASIEHVGNMVTIQTSKEYGVACKLSGTIDSIGNMLLYDDYDNEDWTTHYGPASHDSINLADYVFIGTSKIDTNIIILKR